MFYIRSKSNVEEVKKSKRIINVMMYELDERIGDSFKLKPNENERSGVRKRKKTKRKRKSSN